MRVAVATVRGRGARGRPLCAAAAFFVLLALVEPAAAAVADHYTLTLRPDFVAKVLHGTARLRLKLDAADGKQVMLASPTIDVLQVRAAGQPLSVARTGEGWQVTLDHVTTAAAATGRPVELEVDYRAQAGAGLVFDGRSVYTAFHTCQWMPCVGTDVERAGIDLALDLAEGELSTGNGRRITDDGEGRHRWSQAQPVPLFTFGFAAGAYTEWIDPREPRLRHLGAVDDAAALALRFAESVRMLAFLEDKAGLPLPYPVYTQLLVPGGVAQEASGFAVIGKRMLDPILEDREEDWVIVHEMAHQWWGSLVGCAAWSEVWLNEGLVSFLTAAWKQHRWGDAAWKRELAHFKRRLQAAADAGYDKPLSWPGTYPDLKTLRAVHYSKGALFFAALRAELGEAAFWDGLRRHTRSGAGRNVRAADLQAAMEAAAGRPLSALFAAWVGVGKG